MNKGGSWGREREPGSQPHRENVDLFCWQEGEHHILAQEKMEIFSLNCTLYRIVLWLRNHLLNFCNDYTWQNILCKYFNCGRLRFLYEEIQIKVYSIQAWYQYIFSSCSRQNCTFSAISNYSKAFIETAHVHHHCLIHSECVDGQNIMAIRESMNYESEYDSYLNTPHSAINTSIQWNWAANCTLKL